MSNVKDYVCGFSKLYKAAQICRRNVKWKDSVAHFTNHSLVSVYKLKQHVESETYQISPYLGFVIREPKRRLITSTRFKDRVFQRSLCDNYLTNEISRDFIPDNYACQKGKGTDRARECIERNLKMFYRLYGTCGYVLKVDVHDYFGSTDHEYAIEQVKKRVRDEWTVNEVTRIIKSFNSNGDYSKGIGLGSQVSQLIQLAVLDDLDHYIKEKLCVKLYARYMDDFVLIHEDKDYLKRCLKKIVRFLKRQKLEISPKKTNIFPITQPIKFLGFSFRLTNSGKVTKRILPSNIKAQRRKIKKLYKRVLEGKMTIEKFEECYQSWRAFVKKTDSRGRMLKMDKFKNKLKGELLCQMSNTLKQLNKLLSH